MLLGGGAQAYQIEQSLRFVHSDSHNLERSVSTTSGETQWTVSLWTKFSQSANTRYLFWAQSGTNYTTAEIGSGAINFTQTNNNSVQGRIITRQVFRDFSAWYHLVFVFDSPNATATNRMRLYVNGSEVTDFAADVHINQNHQSSWNQSGYAHRIGRISSSSTYFDGYMAEFHHVSGQVLDPESFGEYDDNGVWRPIEYTGSHGTNGFYLDFSNSSNLGEDQAGSNDWTANNFTTSGTGTDVMSDTPTNNHATLNPLATRRTATIWGGGAYADGNLTFYNTDANFRHTLSTFQVPTGKWYAEIRPIAYGSAYGSLCGLMLESLEGSPDSGDHFGMYFQTNGNLMIEGTNQTTFTTNSDVFSIAVDNTVSPVQVVVRKNDTIVGSNPYSFTANEPFSFYSRSVYGAYHSWNFGAQGFTYTPPSGYKALNTSNLPAPDIADGSQYFNTSLWTGTGSPVAVTGVGFQPDLVWVKARSRTADHKLQDSVRGSFRYLQSNLTNAENTNSGNDWFRSFDSDGFTVAQYTTGGTSTSEWAGNGDTYVGWSWLAANGTSSNTAGSITSTVSASPSSGFSIAAYSGAGSAGTVGHGLGVAPRFLIVKNRSSTTAYNWYVWHHDLSSGSGSYYLNLNRNVGRLFSNDPFNATAPTATVFSVGGENRVNGVDYIAYCFAEVEGFSKFGSYTGNNTTNNAFVYCGFAPAWLMVKSYGTGGTNYDWRIYDSQRNTYNPVDDHLEANSGLGEDGDSRINPIDFLSNGFKVRQSYAEVGSSTTYVFAAFAEHPFGGVGVSPATAR